ncbi:MAG: hypothetical protein H8E10_09200 [Desulfobacterales bacterium]|nr:hypothetical protein [Desulfobacterales bacterium]
MATKPTGNPVGRPTVMTPDVLSKLEQAFSIGATDLEACAHAGCATPSYYRYIGDHPEFRERVNALKEKLPLKAKSRLAKLINDGDKTTVLWYLERKKRNEFSLKTEIDHTTQGEKITHEMTEADLDEKLRSMGIIK